MYARACVSPLLSSSPSLCLSVSPAMTHRNGAGSKRDGVPDTHEAIARACQEARVIHRPGGGVSGASEDKLQRKWGTTRTTTSTAAVAAAAAAGAVAAATGETIKGGEGRLGKESKEF